ncbi:MAG: hypothetical protein ABIQ95_10935, partial [Bdellovibrionia bacterium]
MKATEILHPKLPTLKDAIFSLIHLPHKFSIIFRTHVWLLLPLIATQLLQKCQDLIDDRFISVLGMEALSVHNIQHSLFLIGHEIGLASATSALIFWKRKEARGKQGSILWLHLLMPVALASVTAAIVLFFLDDLAKYFRISAQFTGNARWYWKLGLLNLIVRTLYIPLNAILIACNQRVKCTLLAAGVLLSKVAFGWFAIRVGQSFETNAYSTIIPMLIIGSGSIVALAIASAIAIKWISRLVDGWEKMDLKSLFEVWPGELGIGAISALSPLIFGFQIAKVNTSPGFFVTYQLALHFTYIITLPVLAGMQIAVRDASAEQIDSLGISFKPLHESRWWPQFFYASLIPSCVLLLITSIFAKPIFFQLYNYPVPKDHLPFLPLFFLSWILWQIGNIFLIMLRASKKNSLATWNFIVAG